MLLDDIVSGVAAVFAIVIAAIITIVIAVGLVFLMSIGGAIFGAVGGWFISMIPYVGDWVVNGFATFGIENVNLVHVGAMLGFVGGFFKSYNVNSK